MTEDLNILFSDDFSRAVEQNLGRDPIEIALDKNLPHAAEVASQVKYLQRAKTKLQSYYSAHCIVPSLAFEQSSSELAAARKTSFRGKLCLDLTCGLGVDSFYLARNFERVVALEKDSKLAEIARENFRRLGVKNIEVFNTSAEDFFAYRNRYANRYTFDLVYADPDRRSAEGKKLVKLSDCSPDIIALLPDIQRVTRHLVVKLSPLFDVDEVFRIFGGAQPRGYSVIKVEVVSVGCECKEIVTEISFDQSAAERMAKTIKAVAIGVGEVQYPVENRAENHAEIPAKTSPQSFEPQRYSYLIIPDVALQKARLAQRYFLERGCFIASNNGYAFAIENPEKTEKLMGRMLKIESIEPFDPKKLKARLKAERVKNVDILKRDIFISTAEIARRIGVREGGAQKIAFTTIAGKIWTIFIAPSDRKQDGHTSEMLK